MTTERDIRNQIRCAEKQGLAQGIEKGLAQGMEQGNLQVIPCRLLFFFTSFSPS